MPFTPGRPITEAEAELFKAMAHAGRVRILELLADNDLTVTQLSLASELEMTHLSQQLAVLRRAGLVVGRRSGKQVTYSLGDPQIVLLLTVARELLTTHAARSQQLADALRSLNGALNAADDKPPSSPRRPRARSRT